MKGSKLKWVVLTLLGLVLGLGVYFTKVSIESENQREAQAKALQVLTDKVGTLESEARVALPYDDLLAGQEAFVAKVTALKKEVIDSDHELEETRGLDRRLSEASKDYDTNIQRALMEKEQKIYGEARQRLDELSALTQPLLTVGNLPIEVAALDQEISQLKEKVSGLTQVNDAQQSFLVEADNLLKNYQGKVNQAEELEREKREKEQREKEQREKEQREKEQKEQKEKEQKERNRKEDKQREHHQNKSSNEHDSHSDNKEKGKYEKKGERDRERRNKVAMSDWWKNESTPWSLAEFFKFTFPERLVQRSLEDHVIVVFFIDVSCVFLKSV